MPSTLKQWIQRAQQRLDSRLEGELLLCHLLDKPRSWLFAHSDEALPESLAPALEALLERRVQGEPLAYLLGQREFYGREFLVNPHVLIPRPETELLVELTLGLNLPDTACLADIGTGSGCIGLTLAAEQPDWSVWLCDLSAEALEVAWANRQALGLDDRVQLARGDLMVALPDKQRFHAIVSNPPYVAIGDEHLDQGDLRFEPAMALSSGADGLDTIRRLIVEAPDYLLPGGWLLIEHGYNQAANVRDLFAQAGYRDISSHRDLAGIERVTLACFNRS
ncbi:MAG: peptide chain release factor N(5)-glutamine methyltransferase [Wenzhouxiangella sp.]